MSVPSSPTSGQVRLGPSGMALSAPSPERSPRITKMVQRASELGFPLAVRWLQTEAEVEHMDRLPENEIDGFVKFIQVKELVTETKKPLSRALVRHEPGLPSCQRLAADMSPGEIEELNGVWEGHEQTLRDRCASWKPGEEGDIEVSKWDFLLNASTYLFREPWDGPGGILSMSAPDLEARVRFYQSQVSDSS